MVFDFLVELSVRLGTSQVGEQSGWGLGRYEGCRKISEQSTIKNLLVTS